MGKNKKHLAYLKETKEPVKKKMIYASIGLIVILGFIAYSNSLNGKFIWDDINLVKNNIYIRNSFNIPKIFTQDIGAGAVQKYNFYRPIQILTYTIDYSLWKLNVKGYHLTNILLHILVALTIYWLINILFKDNLLSLFTSLFFVVHPIHTEAVSYISGRADSLSALFMLICFILYIKSAQSKGIILPLTAVLTYILALLSRENALILPILLLLYHYTFKKIIKLGRFLPILSIFFIYLLLRLTVLKSLLPGLSTSTTLSQRIPGFFIAITNYIRFMLLPFSLHMEYGNQLFNLNNLGAILGIIISFSLLTYAFRIRNSNKLIFFSLSWFFITLLPQSNLYPINACMAEHWLYLPSTGFFLILAKGLIFLYKNRWFKIFALFIASILITFYLCLTIRQNKYWREPITFYKKTLKYTVSPRMYNELGKLHSYEGRHQEALILYKKAIEIDTNYADAYNNLGNAYTITGRKEEAIKAYQKAIEINPNDASVYNNLGNLYSAMGKHEEAINLYKKVLKIYPDFTGGYYNLGEEYRAIGKYKDAIISFKKAIEISPDYANAYYNLSLIYFYEKQFDLAIQYCDKAIELGYRVDPEFLKLLEPFR